MEEDYIHLFMSCSVTCLDKRYRTIKKVNLENSISLKHLVVGYKIFDKDYFDFNFIETILGYLIYKSDNVSEQKSKAMDVCSLFVRELRTRLNVCKIYIQVCCLTRYTHTVLNQHLYSE